MSLHVQKKQVYRSRGIIDTSYRHQRVGGFLQGFSLQGYTQVGVEDPRFLSMFIVYAKEGKKEPFFFFIRPSLATLHKRGSS